jgi:uncharacterized protein YndB with AHSA1/START domain
MSNIPTPSGEAAGRGVLVGHDRWFPRRRTERHPRLADRFHRGSTVRSVAGQEIDIRRTLAAPPEAVWALLDDSASWPSWTPIDEHHPVGPAGPDGTGEERRFRNGRVTVHERIIEREPGRRLVYTLLGGLALRDYRAEITLAPRGAGTDLRWHTTFRPKVPGTGRLYRRALAAATRAFVDGLEAATAPRS